MALCIKDFVDQEIEKSGIDVAKLNEKFWGGKDQIDEAKNVLNVCSEDPLIRYREHFHEEGRAQAFENNLKRISRIHELARQGKVPFPNQYNYGKFALGMGTLYPLSVHHGMFESVVKILGSDEQVKQYWDDIVDYKVLGCYCQTEMGHGSNVQGIETEAIYDESTEEFIINSPTITSTKFWPGDMGKMANHAVVFAKLIIKGESYGVNAFLMQIRSLDTHAALKGIEVGDIGPKYGYFTKDNGYLRFDNVRIKRSQILSRYVSVSKEGNIEIKGDPRIAYATMVFIRVTLVDYNWQVLLSSINGALRYMYVRSQFKTIPNSLDERKLIDYQVSQTKLLPYLAFSYANAFMGQYCLQLHDQMHKDIKNDDFGLMNDFHILASSIKAYYMQECLDGLFVVRELCGAHAYLMTSGVTFWIEAWSPNVTLEGDTYVMYQQTARKLVKVVADVQGGEEQNK